MDKNFYELLGVGPEASAEEIKKAYFALAKKYHPDSGSQKEPKLFHTITGAYKTLSSKEERRAYDATLKKEGVSPSRSEAPVHRNLYKERIHTDREKERRDYQRGLFLKAVFRVPGMAVIFALAGLLDTLLFDGFWAAGLVAGAAIGLMMGIYQNVQLDTFFKSHVVRVCVKGVMGAVFFLSLLYFLTLLVRAFL